MRIAVLSDIHANYPALEEVLKSIEEQEIDAIYCLGDLVGYNIWPNAVISIIRKKGIATLCGNHDQKAVEIHNDHNLLLDDDNFAYNIIGKENIRYLATLPAHIYLKFTFNDKPFTLMMVHGSPYSNKEYLHKFKAEKELLDVFLDQKIDMLVFGHTHKPYHRIIHNDLSSKDLHAVNVGSVGKPKDGDARACYSIITIDQNKKGKTNAAITVEFIRVTYDVEKAAKAIENSLLPKAYAAMLRKAN